MPEGEEVPLALGRREARRRALEVLYAWDLMEVAPSPDVLAELKGYARILVEGVIREKGFIDPAISRASEHWSLERMNPVERNIMRLALYEMFFGPVPPAVAIDEAVELAKMYSGEEAGRFVNGVLARVARDAGLLPARDEEGGGPEPPEVSSGQVEGG